MPDEASSSWKFLVKASIALSIVWVCAWLIVAFTSDPSITELQLNEAGDFWAGLAAPLAFYWLVLGFFQQGRELRLQVEEMKNSVTQFEKQSAIMQKQLDAVSSERLDERLLRELESKKLDLIDALTVLAGRQQFVFSGQSIHTRILDKVELSEQKFAVVSKQISSRMIDLRKFGLLSNSNIQPQIITEIANKLEPIFNDLERLRAQAHQHGLVNTVLEFREADFDNLCITLGEHFNLNVDQLPRKTAGGQSI